MILIVKESTQTWKNGIMENIAKSILKLLGKIIKWWEGGQKMGHVLNRFIRTIKIVRHKFEPKKRIPTFHWSESIPLCFQPHIDVTQWIGLNEL